MNMLRSFASSSYFRNCRAATLGCVSRAAATSLLTYGATVACTREARGPDTPAADPSESPSRELGASSETNGARCVPNGRARNPLISHVFTADPNAVVYGDRVYLYASHDVDGQDGYDMVDYHAFSSRDMVNWQDHGVVIDVGALPWVKNLFAPGACSKNGKYYLYMPNGGTSIGVAVADDPGGPFVDPLGRALITKEFPNADVPWLFDPACFVDDDGQAYLYFGGGDNRGQNARVIRLNDDMVSLRDASATTIPTTAFFEASFVHKRAGTYYFTYSSDFSEGHSGALEYATSTNPMSGFVYRGQFLPNSPINNGNNNHGSIIDFHGNTYLFYHARKLQQSLGVNKVNNRSVALQRLEYDAAGLLVPTRMSTEDFTVSQLACLDGFAEVPAEAFAGEHGIEVEGRAGEVVRVSALDAGDWVGYSQVDFRGGARKLMLRVAPLQGAGTIEVGLDDCLTGGRPAPIGTCKIENTGGAATFVDVECAIAAPAGAHDLCLRVADGGSFELDSWRLE